MFSVAEVMNTDLYTLGEGNTVKEARELMSTHHIRHIPVTNGNNRLLGLVSQRDVLAAADSTLLATKRGSHTDEAAVPVASVMTVSVNTIEETANLRGAALYMQKHKIGCLPVLRGERLVGIITDSDFISVAINLMEQMEEAECEELGDEAYLE